MDAVTAHRLALVAGGRCPACAERLGPRALFGPKPCGACGSRVRDFGLDGTEAARQFERRGTKTVVGVAVAAGLVQLVGGWIPFLDVVVSIAIAGWIRLAIVGPGTAMMSPTRRVVTRLTARLMAGVLLAGLLVFSELLTLLGPLGLPLKAGISVLQVFAGVFVVTRYTETQLKREARGMAVEASEIVLLVGVLFLLLGVVVGLTVALLWVVQTLEAFLGGGA